MTSPHSLSFWKTAAEEGSKAMVEGMSSRSCLLFTFLCLMITKRKCIAAQEEEQGFLSNHTWGVTRKVRLLEGVLWETWDALVPPMCLNYASSAKATQPRVTGHSSIRHWPWQVVGHIPGSSVQAAWHTQHSKSLQLDEHQLCIVSKSKMLEHEAGNSKKQHEQSKCQRNEKCVQNCDRVLGYFSHNIINRLSSKISNTWEEITKIFKDTIFVFWMLIWHKGVCMRECL